ncbi:MAG TPA: PD-(D/E)XK nuclease family protein [Verrucomicrobiota bacterium]|nr:PD-(D/E)XK nuclease family protein [Verrucomicrobiota bacterium]
MSCSVSVLIGPAGSGKTTHCVNSARQIIKESPKGLPLIFLLPRQATFQIEQLVYSEDAVGSTRLQVVNFERICLFLYKHLGMEIPHILSQESCAMLLQVILNKHGGNLKFYSRQCTDAELIDQLLETLVGLHQQKVSVDSLKKVVQGLAADSSKSRLSDKLADITFLYERYLEWLQEKSLLDQNVLLIQLAQILNQWKADHPNECLIEQVWVDGFVDLSQQEIDFFGALANVSRAATIVICLEIEPDRGKVSVPRPFWNHTLPLFKKTLSYFSDKPCYNLKVVPLNQDTKLNRFSEAPLLGLLEKKWLAQGEAVDEKSGNIDKEIEICQCPEIWDEAVFAARKIIEYLQKGGTRRYRDCFVVFRNLNAYQGAFQRVFRRYNIPFFVDTPQSIIQHRAAELTLQAFKTVTFGWRNFNLLSFLKTELAGASVQEIDILEEELLKHNDLGIELWNKKLWEQWLSSDKGRGAEDKTKGAEKAFREIHKKSIAPLLEFDKTLRANETISGDSLCSAIEALWNSYGLQISLEKWSQKNWDIHAGLGSGLSPNVHLTAWEELKSWLGNIRLAFGSEHYALAEWAKIMEAGIKSIFVAAIPPSLDQVVLGNIDRSRSSSVKLVIVPGANETVFPAYEEEKSLFTDNELQTLQNLIKAPVALRQNSFQKTDKENYLSYMSFTRSSQKLVVSYAGQNDTGAPLKPSRYVFELKKIFPQLQEQKYSKENLRDNDTLKLIENQVQSGTEVNQQTIEDAVSRFYEPGCSFSVSNIESYANCPFQFFIKGIAKCREREEWGIRSDKLGNLMHHALHLFNEKVQKADEKKSWRLQLQDELGTRKLVKECVDEAVKEIVGQKDDSSLTDFGVSSELLNTEKKINFFLDTMNVYFKKYQFDPIFTELDFGKDLPLKPIITVNKKDIYISGRTDRIDLYRDESNNIWVVVIDYKSSEKKILVDTFEAGIQLQLISYLYILKNFGFYKLASDCFNPKTNESIEIAGAFYVQLKTPYFKNREALNPFQHFGRFDKSLLSGNTAYLDNLNSNGGVPKQFRISNQSPDPIDKEELLTLTVQAKEIIGLLIKMILKGDYSAKPISCDYCIAKSVCRFDPRRLNTEKLKSLLSKSQEAEVTTGEEV